MHQAPCLPQTVRPPKSDESGFSLVEITLAIGIIAFAFVALFGLLPVGLSTLRGAIDTSNETRILQSFVGKVQVTNFNEIKTLSFPASQEIYFFDEEGSLIDTSLQPKQGRENERIYEAKLFIEDATDKKGQTNDMTNNLNFSVNVLVVFAPINSPSAKQFEQVKMIDDLRMLLPSQTTVRTRSMLVSKMDATPR